MKIGFFLMSGIVTTALLAGCGTQSIKGWSKADTTNEQRDKDMAECKYEASKATTGDGKAPANTGDAVGQGVVRGMEESDLIKQCMKIRGYAP